METMVSKIRDILKQMNIFPDIESLKNNDNLFTAGALDSLVMIQFVLGIEDEFKIRLANEDINYEKFENFEKIAQLVQKSIGT